MPRSLRVTVNREGHQEVDARTKRFAADGPFTLAVDNRGEGCHVHLAVSGDLALDADADPNPYLAAEETLEVPVDVVTDLRPATGTVTVTTGYGRNEAAVDVRVNGDEAEAGSAPQVPPEEVATADDDGDDGGGALARVAGLRTGVAGLGAGVAERVRGGRSSDGEDAEADASRSLTERLRPPSPEELGPGALLVLALSVLALFAALLAHATFGSTFVTAAVLLVVATVLGAGAYLLVR